MREEKSAIIAEIGVEGSTVPDVSRRHNIVSYLVKRWGRQLSPVSRSNEASPIFVAVVVADPEPAAVPSVLLAVDFP